MVLKKLGLQPATPGLQGIALIHCSTAASILNEFYVKKRNYYSNKCCVSFACTYISSGYLKQRFQGVQIHELDKLRKYMGVTRYCLSFSFTEKTKNAFSYYFRCRSHRGVVDKPLAL